MAGITEKQTAWKRSYHWLHTESTKVERKDSMSNEIQLAQKGVIDLGVGCYNMLLARRSLIFHPICPAQHDMAW